MKYLVEHGHTWARAAFADTICQNISVLQKLMRYAMAVKKGSFGVVHVSKKCQLLHVVTTDYNYYSYHKEHPSLF